MDNADRTPTPGPVPVPVSTTNSGVHSQPWYSGGSPSGPSPGVCWAIHVSAAAVVISALYFLAPGLLEALKTKDWTAAGAHVVVIALVTSPTGLKDLAALVRLARGNNAGDK